MGANVLRNLSRTKGLDPWSALLVYQQGSSQGGKEGSFTERL